MGRSAGQKTVCVTRIGAIGDMIITTPIYPLLKSDGYYVIANTSKKGIEVLKNNPYIDEFLEHDTSISPNEQLDNHWNNLKKGYDKFINLSESIEGTLSKVPSREDFFWSKEKRHKECDVNFYDRTLEIAGYGDVKGVRGQLFFSSIEESIARNYRKQKKGKYLVMWVLAGSSPHKSWPFTEYAISAFLDKHPDALILVVGDDLCAEFFLLNHPRVKHYASVWGVRKTMIMTKYVDLVIGPDTGIMHAAGCFDTPKILLHSANSINNLSIYWKNTIDIMAHVKCQPCHRLHYTTEYCELHPIIKTPLCMAAIKLSDILYMMDKKYQEWRENKNGILHRKWGPTEICA